MEKSLREMFLDAAAIEPSPHACNKNSIGESIWPQGLAIRKRKPGDPQAEPSCQCRERQREDKPVIETISQSKEKQGRKEQVVIPIALHQVKSVFQVGELHSE